MKQISKLFCWILSLLLIIFQALSVGATEKSYSWFCAHKKDHLQPIADASLCFIERYDGYYIDKNHGDNCQDKVVYLTFDAGYENGNVSKILDVLKTENVPAAFFVLGAIIKKNTDVVMRMFDEGHLVCNHTYSHKPMKNLEREAFCAELQRLEETCLEYTGNPLARFYRPPEGVFDEQSLAYAKEMGYKTVFWSFGYPDWDNGKQMDKDAAKRKILDNVHNGEIMLLHPTSATNAAILGDVIRDIKAMGYRFGTLDEL